MSSSTLLFILIIVGFGCLVMGVIGSVGRANYMAHCQHENLCPQCGQKLKKEDK